MPLSRHCDYSAVLLHKNGANRQNYWKNTVYARLNSAQLHKVTHFWNTQNWPFVAAAVHLLHNGNGEKNKLYQHEEYFNKTRVKFNCLILKDQFIKLSYSQLKPSQHASCSLNSKRAFFFTLRQAKAISTLPGIKHVWDVLFICHFFQPHLWMLVASGVVAYGSTFLGSWGWWFFASTSL